MSSPFSSFRKHQRGIMAAMVLIAMFSFIVLGAADQLMDLGASRNPEADEVVATWSGGEFTAGDIAEIASGRMAINQFAHIVAEHAAKNAALRELQVRVNLNVVDEEQLVNSALFAEEGRRLGIVITDSNVDEYIKSLSTVEVPGQQAPKRDTVREDQIRDAVKRVRVHDRGVSYAQIREAIRREMLVNEAGGVLFTGDRFDVTATPAERWEHFCRFNRRMKLQVYPIDVNRFVDDQRIPKPTEDQLRAFYDVHKDAMATRESPEIGFKQPDRAKVEYLRADYVTFIEAAKAKLTDKELRDEFAKHKDNWRTILERDEGMLPRFNEDEPDAKDDKAAAEKTVHATEPDATPYESAVGLFAKKAPRPTEPPFTDDELFQRNREQLVKRLSERNARAMMAKALDAAYSKMTIYFEKEYRPWATTNADKSAGSRPPAPKFELAAMVDAKTGLQYGQTPTWSVEDYFLDKNFRYTSANVRWGTKTDPRTNEEVDVEIDSGTPLTSFIFTGNREKRRPFRAEDSIKGSGEEIVYRNQYVMWVTDFEKEHLPDFADIEDEVRRAWRMANDEGPSARRLAMAQAERHAQDANGQEKTLKELFSDAPEVLETSEFSWYMPSETTTAFGRKFDGQRPDLTRLDEVRDGGRRFAHKAINLDDKEAAAILNDSGTVAYVVQPFDSPGSTRDELRLKFTSAPYEDNQGLMQQLLWRQEGIVIAAQQGYIWASVPDMGIRHYERLESFTRSFDLDWKRDPYRGRDE